MIPMSVLTLIEIRIKFSEIFLLTVTLKIFITIFEYSSITFSVTSSKKPSEAYSANNDDKKSLRAGMHNKMCKKLAKKIAIGN